MASKSLKIKYLVIISSLFFLLTLGGYYFFFRGLIESIYQDNTPEFWAGLVNAFYPRFAVEKQRFPVEFFIQKADQIILRILILLFLSNIFFIYYQSKAYQTFSQKWQKPITTFQAKTLLKLYFFVMLAFTWDWGILWSRLIVWEEFYQAISFLKVLNLTPLSSIWVWILLMGMLLLTALSAWSNFRFWTFLFSFFLFIILQGYFLSFQKIDHNFASFTYATWGILLLTYDLQKVESRGEKELKGASLKFTQLLIAIPYFEAGLEKLLIGGLEWWQVENFKMHAMLHNSEFALKIAEFDFLVMLLLSIVIFFQLGFMSIVFFPKLKIVFLPLGLVFHLGTYLLLGVGGWISPWWLLYAFFIDWNFLKNIILFLSIDRVY